MPVWCRKQNQMLNVIPAAPPCAFPQASVSDRWVACRAPSLPIGLARSRAPGEPRQLPILRPEAYIQATSSDIRYVPQADIDTNRRSFARTLVCSSTSTVQGRVLAVGGLPSLAGFGPRA